MTTTMENEFDARLHQTALALGIGFSALTTSRLPFQFPAGWPFDRVERKVLMLVGVWTVYRHVPGTVGSR
jgi:MFS family permease